MSVPNQTPYNIYTANGVTTVFPFGFLIFDAGDLVVSLNGTALTSGFTVSGVSAVNGGSVTFLTPPVSDAVVMLARNMPLVRQTEYQDNGDLLAATINKDFDRIWMVLQGQAVNNSLNLARPGITYDYYAGKGYRVSGIADPVSEQDAATKIYTDSLVSFALVKTLRVPETSVSAIPAIDARRNKVLAFDDAGNPIALTPESGSATDVLIQLAKPTGASLIGDGEGTVATERLSIHGGTMQGALVLAGDATDPKGAVTKQQLDAKPSGLPLLFSWWEENRAHIPDGTAPRDGQELNRALFPDAWAEANAKGLVISEAEWQADPLKRMRWSSGNGTTTFRLPDENGKSPGSVGAPVRRGDGAKSNGVTGTIQMDAMRNIKGTFGTNGLITDPSVKDYNTPPFSMGPNPKNTLGAAWNNSNISPMYTFDAGTAPGVLVAEENRMLNATGCYVVKLAGAAFNEGQINALELATQITLLTTRVTTLEAIKPKLTTILYPNGTETTPATIAINQRLVIDNPFPTRRIACVAEILMGNGAGGLGGPRLWGNTNIVTFSGSGGAGVAANAMFSATNTTGIPDNITIKSGGTWTCGNSNEALNGFNLIPSNVNTAVPYRVRVWTID